MSDSKSQKVINRLGILCRQETHHAGRPGGLVIAHNINPRMADLKYMEAITTNPNLETIVRSGVSVTLKKR
ncbi:MAG TPA: hypothetical protein VMY06_11260 [Sedimentisphaerales bacterium]|nr:hypothetical protein [Sedimentisphaerales bacterium]